MKYFASLFALVLLFCSCRQNPKEEKDPSHTQLTTEVITLQDSVVAIGEQVLLALKTNNLSELRKYFSEDGVIFSPYGYIDLPNCKRLTADDFINIAQKNDILLWGQYDGTGEPIRLSVNDYIKKFIYNADYLDAEAVGFDKIIKQGNAINNLSDIFPQHHYVDYHFSGFDPKFKGMDWSSLRLVFEKQNGEYFLVAVIHDQWTV